MTQRPRSPSVFILSRPPAAEFQPALAAVRQTFADGDVRSAADIGAVEALVRDEGWFPDLAVVCLHCPGEHSSRDVARLWELLPLARWIVLLGAWCEADGRNRTPWPDSVRVPARAAAGRIELERMVLDGEADPLPLTASRDEAFAFDNHIAAPTELVLENAAEPAVAIHTADAALRHLLRDVLAVGGFAPPPTHAGGKRAAAIVWDADPISARTEAELDRLRENDPQAVVLALATMAHPEDAERLTAAGAFAVLSKSQIAGDLLPTLQAAVASCGGARRPVG